jgi:uncharacterized caspase-like protein
MQIILRDVGFDVDLLKDTRRTELEHGIDIFLKKVNAGDVVLIHYSGHGMQIRGENYLIPVDFDATSEAIAERQGYPVSSLVEHLGSKRAKLNILVLDACRNNPFLPTRSVAGGLAGMEATKVTGTYIAFATAPDKTADDNEQGDYGLFTGQLVDALRAPGLSLDEVFNRVRERVHEISNGVQVPWSSSSVIGQFIFRDRSQSEKALAALQVEAGQLERQLTAIDKRSSDNSGRRQEEAQQAERNRREWSARLERLKQEQAKREAELRNVIDLERRRNAEESAKREQELARQQAEARALVEDLRAKAQQARKDPETMTLEEARKSVALAQTEIASRTKEISAIRDKELAQIDTTYSSLKQQASQPLTKDIFETTVEFSQRQMVKLREQADIDRRWKEARSERISYYDTELQRQLTPFQVQIHELTHHDYPAEPLPAAWKDYDADRNTLTVTAGPLVYRFDVHPAKAREVYNLKDELKIESKYLYSEEGTVPIRFSVMLVDPIGDRFAKLEDPSPSEVSPTSESLSHLLNSAAPMGLNGTTATPLINASVQPSAGPALDPSESQIQAIVSTFIANETESARVATKYTYRQIVKVNILNDDGTPSSEVWQSDSDIIFSSDGQRTEKLARPPVNRLRRLILASEDERNLRNIPAFVLTSDELSSYQIRYLGHETVDEIPCYVFAIKPADLKPRKFYFSGEVWVDDKQLQIVKTYGRYLSHLKNDPRTWFPKIETYRQQIDGAYWFPTYRIGILKNAPIRAKLVIKLEDYRLVH